jgi:uncharacterized repeat protein (TIGR01451 family)
LVVWASDPWSSAENVTLTDTLDPSVTYLSATPAGSCSFQGTARTVTCKLGTLDSGASTKITIVVVASSVVGSVSNTASVDGVFSDFDHVTNSTKITTTVGSISDLSISKVASPTVVGPGGTVTDTLVATNNGPDATAGDVVVTDTLPPGVSYVSANPASCVGPSTSDVTTTRSVHCNLGKLNSGSSVVITVTTTIQAGQEIVNQARVGGSLVADPISANDRASITIVCQGCPELAAGSIGNAAVAHFPTLVVVSDALTFTAAVFSSEGMPRSTGTIQIWVANDAEIKSNSPPTNPAASCRFGAMCEYKVSNLTASSGRFAYKAVAFDELGGQAETPWRMVDVVDPNVSQLGLSGPLIMTGVVTPSDSFGAIQLDRTADIAFFPGTGFDLTTGAGRLAFSTRLNSDIWVLSIPLNAPISLPHLAAVIDDPGPPTPTTFLANQANVSFWVSPQSVAITPSDPRNPDPRANRCNIGSISIPTFTQANGVLHTVDCIDNAPGNRFTSNGGDKTWHELHHALFGLADEYCCDGGYWQADPFPNLYFWPDDCRGDYLSNGTCLPVRRSGTIFDPWQWTRWWRVDESSNDIMIDNTLERPADRRRANWFFDQCRSGRC